MNNSLYVHLTRQSGLMKEMDIIATNLANMNTVGYRREATVFSEYIKKTDDDLGSLSMTATRARYADNAQGALRQTGSQLDFAIEGDAFFQVQAPQGVRMTRAGSFALSPTGGLVTLDGYPVLDEGGAAIQLPPGAANFAVSPDGAISVDGQALARLGVVAPQDSIAIRRDGDSLYIADGPVQQSETARVSQGFVEHSNVDAVVEISRMIEVQRAYELGQSLVEEDDQRLRETIRTLGETQN